MRGTGRLVRLAVAVVLAAASLLPAAAPAAAADPILPRPAATVSFLSGVTFTGTARLPDPVDRLEIVIDIEGSPTSVVADVAAPGIGGIVDLRYILDTSGGSLFPNTDLTARFRVTLDDGTFVDGPSSSILYDDPRFDWRSLRGDLMTVHWVVGDAAFGRRALRIGEEAVRSAADLFGVTELDPIDFFIYPDEASFYDVIGAADRENVGGTALPEIRTLFAKIEPARIDDPWVGHVIPHELAHLVFFEATRNPYHQPLHWLDEGIADYLARGADAGDRYTVDRAIDDRTFMPLQGLVGQFPPEAELFHLAYAESVLAVDFLVRRYGKPAMVKLVRSYAAAVTDDEAFLDALGTDTAGFDAAWLEDLGVEPPKPYGPRDAPPGPVPSDWLGDAPVPGGIDEADPSSGSSATDEPAFSNDPAPDAPGDATALLVALGVVGLALAGLGLWLTSRNRPSRAIGVPSSDVSPEPTPGDGPEPALDGAVAPVPDGAVGLLPDDAAPPSGERVP